VYVEPSRASRQTPIMITFRPLTPADAQSLFAIYADKEAMKFRGSKPMETLQDAEQYIRDQRVKKCSVLTLREGVEFKNRNVLIGSVMYRYDETKPEECEIGYSIGRTFWGRGFGHTILQQMLKALQDRADIKQIIAECHKDNMASIKVLAKAGFEYTGQVRPDISIYKKRNHPA